MSGIRTKRSYREIGSMTAYGGKADIRNWEAYDRYRHIADL